MCWMEACDSDKSQPSTREELTKITNSPSSREVRGGPCRFEVVTGGDRGDQVRYEGLGYAKGGSRGSRRSEGSWEGVTRVTRTS